VLIAGPTEAVLIDGGFTLSDGRALAEAIRAVVHVWTADTPTKEQRADRGDEGPLPRPWYGGGVLDNGAKVATGEMKWG
jgi:hypothetical protein